MKRRHTLNSETVVKLRKIVRGGSGDSLYICLPREFIKLHNLKKGDKVPVLADHILKVVPMKEI